MAEPESSALLVQVRSEGTIRQMDIATLITLIQQNALDAQTEVNSQKLTQGEWRRLGGLDIFLVLRDRRGTRSEVTQPETKPEPAELYEDNLKDFFRAPVFRQLRVDSTIAITATALGALLTILVHRYALIFVITTLGWGVGFLLGRSALVRKWILTIRGSGLRRLPWSSRHLVLIAIAFVGYLLLASFLPELPKETLFRVIDAVVCVLFSTAAGIVWTFQLELKRMKRAFDLSCATDSRCLEPDAKE